MSRDILRVALAFMRGIPTGLPSSSGLGRIRNNLDASIASRASQASVDAVSTKVDTLDSVLDTSSSTVNTIRTKITTADTVADTINGKVDTIDGNVDDIETRMINIDNLLRTNNTEPSSQTGSLGSMVRYLVDNPASGGGGVIAKRGMFIDNLLLAETESLDYVRRFTKALPSGSGSTKVEVVSSTSQDVYIYALSGHGSSSSSVPDFSIVLYKGSSGSEVAIAGGQGLYGNPVSVIAASIFLPGTFVYVPSGTRLSATVNNGSSVNFVVYYLLASDFVNVS